MNAPKSIKRISTSPPFVADALARMQEEHTDAMAIRDGTRKIAWVQLVNAMEALSERISGETGPSDTVALLIERSAELLVAMCACLHAGRCFAPIRPSLPVSYRNELIEVTQAALPLTTVDVSIPLDATPHRIGSPRRGPRPAQGAELAYLLCTSGSTGRPKPVMVRRGGLDNYLQWASRYYRMDRLQGAVAQLSPTFDAFVTQSILPLLSGCPVWVIPVGDELIGFSRALSECSGSWLVKLTPGQLLVLAAEDAARTFSHLRGELVIGGEALTAAHVQWARRLFPGLRLHNEYGPTETVVGSAVHTVGLRDAVPPAIPIGRPIDNTELLVLRSDGTPCAVEEIGEICVAGAGLAHAYLGQPAATASVFVPNDLSEDPGGRLYRTGDFGWVDAESTFHYLGRNDTQVKIRGQRVEIADVQRRIASLSAVASVAIDVSQDASGSAVLVAYVQPASQHAMADIRETCAARLPAALLPSRWLEIDQIPLTSHGKVDYATLRERLASPAPSLDASLADLAAIWAALLGHRTFGPDDSLFDVGGHSLLTVRLRARLRSELGLTIALADLIKHSTLREMSQLIARCRMQPARAEGAVTSRPLTGPFPLSPTQQQIWLASAQARAHHQPDPYSVPAAARVTGPLDAAKLHAAFALVAQRHEIFRLRFTAGDRVLQDYGDTVRWEWTQETIDDEAEALRQIESPARADIDPGSGALLRIHLMKIRYDLHVLLLATHHLISDQWSMQVLLREAAAVYRGEDLPPAPGSNIYREYCEQQAASTEAALCESLGRWVKRLANNTTLPVGPRRKSAHSRSSAHYELILPADEVAQLEARAHVASCTPNTVALTVAAAAMGLAQDLQTVRFSFPAALRDPQFQHTVGCFLVTLCVTAELTPTATFWEITTAMREEMLAAFADPIPYSLLQARAPLLASGDLVHARFVFSEDPLAAIRLPNCAVHTLPVPRPGSKFALLIGAQYASGNLTLRFEFDPDAFTRLEIEKLTRAASLAASALAADPAVKVAALRERFRQAESTRFSRTAAALASSLGAALQHSATAPKQSAGRPNLRVSHPEWLKGATLAEISARGTPLVAWLKGETDGLHELRSQGALLLRGFSIDQPGDFEDAISYIDGAPLCDYENRSTPRQRVRHNVFTSTEYPRSEFIPLHNENSYSHRWPARIAFWCVEPAYAGGETPIADSRRVWRSISDTTRAEFELRGVLYARTYNTGLSWQETFQTSDRSAVEEYCAQNDISWQWHGDELHTRQRLPAVRRHPVTGEPVWFNQAHLFHLSSIGLAEAEAIASFGASKLPRHAMFGDGTPIPASMIQEIRAAYEQHAAVFPWHRGDLLLLDNMLWAHGRRPFEGSRRVLVAMTRPMDSRSL